MLVLYFDWVLSILMFRKTFFFSISETRLVEIMEGLCDESASEVCF